MSLLQCIGRELTNAFIHDARRAIFLFGAAAAYLILFGILYYPGVVKDIPTVICDESHTAYSRALTKHFTDTDSFSVVRVVSDEEEARQMMREKQAYTAVIIPQDFAKQILTGQSSQVLVMMNGANIITTNISSTAASDVINAFNDRVAARQAALRTSGDEGMLGRRISPVHTSLRVLNNPTQSYMMFFVLGLALAAMQQGIFLSIGAAVQGDIHDKKLKGSLPWTILAVKLGVYWVLTMLSFCFICFLAYVLGIPNRASASSLVPLSAAFAYTALSLGLMGAAVFRTELQFVRASVMYTVPAFIFGGYTWPMEAMDPVTQMIASLFPMAWLSNAVRELFLSGHFALLQRNVCALLILGTIFLVIGSLLFCRRMKNGAR